MVRYIRGAAHKEVALKVEAARIESQHAWFSHYDSEHCLASVSNDEFIVVYIFTTDGSRVRYTYTEGGRLATRVWSRGITTAYAYDTLGQLASVNYSDNTPDVFFSYDVFGHTVASSNSFASYEYRNSLSGIATNELVAVGTNTCWLDRRLGGFSRLTELHAAGNAPVCYGYDTESRLASASNGAFTVAYALTADGQDAGYAVTLTNGLAVTRAVTRDPHRRHLVTAVSNAVGVSSHSAIEYGYDILGNVTDRNNDAFGYNARYELAYALLGADRFNYSYDSIGNNLWISVNAVTNTYAANRLNQYSLISNHVNHVNPVRIHPTCDADGNMRWDGRLWHTWDAENRLTRSEPGFGFATNGARRTYNRYDHKGRLVESGVEVLSGRGADYPFDPSQPGTWDAVESRTFIYDGWLPVLEKINRTGGAAEIREHVWGKDLSGTRGGAGGVGGLLATRINDAWYFPLYDNNGNITDYINESGATVAHREYCPFGKTLVASGPMADVFNFWFSTKYLHHETGLYYYGYRFYNPELMRWLNRDPVEERGGRHLYCFVNNNPVSFYDLFGLYDVTGPYNRLEIEMYRKIGGGWGSTTPDEYMFQDENVTVRITKIFDRACNDCYMKIASAEATVRFFMMSAPIVDLPVWRDFGGATLDQKAAWLAMLIALSTHEQGHVAIFNSYNGTETVTGFGRSCDAGAASALAIRDLKENARRAATVRAVQTDNANILYDFDTNDGKTQGVVLPNLL